MRLQKTYAGDAFVMIGISSDDPAIEPAVREYIERNRMAWPQNLDRTRQVHNLFQIRHFPTYIVVDSEGIVRERLHGWTQTTISRLESAIKNSMKAAGRLE